MQIRVLKSWAIMGVLLTSGLTSHADLAIQSFGSTGQLTFNELNNGSNYNYRVEWAPSPSGPWSAFSGASALMDGIIAATGSGVTNTVPMCYRVVATLGDYMVVDLSGGTNASSYPVSYYRTLADLPGGVGVNNDVYKTTNMVFRRIPAGTFVMGAPTSEIGRNSDEAQHQVTLTQPFYIGVFEVTQKQWERVMGTWPSYFTNAVYRDSRPVDQVSYNAIRGTNNGTLWPATNSVDATSFMGRLRARTGKAFDLPTESQREYAGRAGTTTSMNSGKNLTSITACPNVSELGRYYSNCGPGYTQNGDTSVGSAKVGSYLPNAWGIYDLHGNVWEWCLDWYGDYPGTASDPVGALTGSACVLRGGCWNSGANNCRVGFRGSYSPSINYGTVGLRVALHSGQ